MRLSKNCTKLRQRLRREIGKRDILILLFRRSIKNLTLSDFSYTKQAGGQIRLIEINKLVWRIGIEKIEFSKRIMQEIAKKLMN